MDKRNFISVTLLVSALAFNPLVATELNTKVTSSQRQIQTYYRQYCQKVCYTIEVLKKMLLILRHFQMNCQKTICKR